MKLSDVILEWEICVCRELAILRLASMWKRSLRRNNQSLASAQAQPHLSGLSRRRSTIRFPTQTTIQSPQRPPCSLRR